MHFSHSRRLLPPAHNSLSSLIEGLWLLGTEAYKYHKQTVERTEGDLEFLMRSWLVPVFTDGQFRVFFCGRFHSRLPERGNCAMWRPLGISRVECGTRQTPLEQSCLAVGHDCTSDIVEWAMPRYFMSSARLDDWRLATGKMFIFYLVIVHLKFENYLGKWV